MRLAPVLPLEGCAFLRLARGALRTRRQLALPTAGLHRRKAGELRICQPDEDPDGRRGLQAVVTLRSSTANLRFPIAMLHAVWSRDAGSVRVSRRCLGLCLRLWPRSEPLSAAFGQNLKALLSASPARVVLADPGRAPRARVGYRGYRDFPVAAMDRRAWAERPHQDRRVACYCPARFPLVF